MINATLGPPPAAAGKVGPADPPAEGIDAPASDHDGGGFSAALRDAASSPAPTAKDGRAHNDTAAGPAEGELHQTTAEAGDQDQTVTAALDAAIAGTTATATTVAAAATTATAAVATTASTTAATTATAVTAIAGTAATATTAAPGQAGPAAPGLVVAAAANTAGATGVVAATAGGQGTGQGTADGRPGQTAQTALTAGTATTTATPGAPAAAVPAGTATTAVAAGTAPQTAPATGTAPADATGAAAPVTRAQDDGGTSGPRPAATLTITLAPITPDAGTAGSPAVPGTAPGGAGTEAGKPALVPPAPGGESKAAAPAAPSPVPTAPLDPSMVGGPTASTGPASAAGGAHGTGHAGAAGAAHAAELAKDIGMRMHVSLREGGREVMLSMRPPELGHVVVRMVMHDGVLQAHVIADRPEAARMLEQALPHLGEALSERGYTLEGMDISYRHEAQERPATAMDGRRGSHGLGIDADVPFADGADGAVSDIRTTAGPGRLNLLA